MIELAGGLLVAFGLFASPAGFVASGEMAVAYFKAHLPQSFWPLPCVLSDKMIAALSRRSQCRIRSKRNSLSDAIRVR